MSGQAVSASASANANADASVGAVSADAISANATALARRLSPAAFPPLLDHHLPPTERFRAND